MSKYKNIYLEDTQSRENFVSPRSFRFSLSIPDRSRFSHGNSIKSKLESIWARHDAQDVVSLNTKQGIYFEFKGKINYDLSTQSLENVRQGIRLLNIRKDKIENEKIVTSATIFVPHKARGYFIKKVDQYLTVRPNEEKPKNQKLIDSIENIREAVIESFWTGNKNDIPGDLKKWCEIWMYTDGIEKESIDLVKAEMIAFCNESNIEFKDSYIYFPERIVSLINVDEKDIEVLINHFSHIAELRRAPLVPSYYLDFSYSEKKEVVDDLISRILHNNENDVSVCIFDTGVNNSNPLIESFLDDKDRHTYDTGWGFSDLQGHGTQMAGIAIYFNLEALAHSKSQHIVNHILESVKILPPSGRNKEELYGAITNQSFSLPEIEAPQRKRVYCMAVSAPDFNTFDGSPTSWSAEIDNLSSGVQDDIKRLIILSSGNVTTDEIKSLGFPNANLCHSIENPAQSWNALTVGAYSEKVHIADPFLEGFHSISNRFEMSPWNSTSDMWNEPWPIKPDVVFDGGNMATDGTNVTNSADLSLLTTNKDPRKIFDVICATSSATAQASYFAAKLYDMYPDYWPETIRGLIVHSASWSNEMIKYLPSAPTKKDYRKLLKMVGFGIPDLDKAVWTSENQVNMIVQDTIQPYNRDSNSIKLNEMHLHDIPWPKDTLRLYSSEDIEVRVRITLSYFIEPGPGEIGWKNRYRYPSAVLRFDMNNTGESKQEFMARINKDQRDSEQNTTFENDTSRWTLGSTTRHKGSIHSDIWEGSPSELIDTNFIAVYPVGGWWKERSQLKQYNRNLRYSLIISIESPEEVIDLYTPIITEIQNRIRIGVEVST